MADSNKTEKATPRRREKAREQGQVARSRELASALAFLAATGVLWWQGVDRIAQWRRLFYVLLDRAGSSELRLESPILLWTGQAALSWMLFPLCAIWMTTVVASFAQGGLNFAPAALAFKPERLSPIGKLKQILSTTSLVSLAKSLIPTGAIAYLAWQIFLRQWPATLAGLNGTARSITSTIFAGIFELSWKSGLVLLIWSAVDYAAIRQKYESDLKMSKQELREEFKESEGNPATKSRIRRLQRQARRTHMLKDVQRATVVVTNPTHFAVALEYRLEMAAPVVVAKGRNLLAEQIKEAARWHGIPIMENPPLARALYKSVQVGQAIPAKLYAAVAEILAFVFRMQTTAKEGSR